MREIKFRGRKPNEEWIYGDLVRSEDDILGDVTTCIFPQKAYDSYDRYIVDANTVGQFTGLRDKNGKEIYEGDILDFIGLKIEVRFVRGVFALLCNGDLDYEICGDCGTDLFAKVIGNIHDNPELLNN